jgi:hypothetical protein
MSNRNYRKIGAIFSFALLGAVTLVGFQNCAGYEPNAVNATNAGTQPNVVTTSSVAHFTMKPASAPGGCTIGTQIPCAIENGDGVMDCEADPSTCSVVSCDAGFVNNGDQACVAAGRAPTCEEGMMQACRARHGTGAQICSNSGWGICVANACSQGFALVKGNCVANVANGPCSGSFGATFNGQNYGAITVMRAADGDLTFADNLELVFESGSCVNGAFNGAFYDAVKTILYSCTGTYQFVSSRTSITAQCTDASGSAAGALTLHQ